MSKNKTIYFHTDIPKLQNNKFIPPYIIKECILNIEKNCDLEGLFEYDIKNPYKEQIEEFQEQLKTVKKGSISTILPNTYVACGILKKYFDSLKNPVIPLDKILNNKENTTEKYTEIIETLQNLPLQNQHLLAYITNFCYRLQRKQSRMTPDLLGKVLGSHIIRNESCSYSKESVSIYTLIIKQYNQHFKQGTSVPIPPPAKTVSIYDDDDTPGGYIAVRVNNYPVTKIIKGVQVKSVRALYKFEARKPEEISMDIGDIIEVTYQDEEPGWWEGKIRGCTGAFPSNYCEVYEILKRKRRKMKIDTTKVSDKILSMQSALSFNSAPPKEDSEENLPIVEEEKKENETQPSNNIVNEQPEELPNLKQIKFTELKIYEDITKQSCTKAKKSLELYHKILFESQQQLLVDINKGESNEPVVFFIDDNEIKEKSENSTNEETTKKESKSKPSKNKTDKKRTDKQKIQKEKQEKKKKEKEEKERKLKEKKEKQEQEKLLKEKENQQRIEKEKQAKEKKEKEEKQRIEKEQQAKEKKEKEERLAREKKEKEEKQRIEKEKQEKEKKEKEEQERIQKEKEEKERIEKEKKEQEEKERIEKEKQEEIEKQLLIAEEKLRIAKEEQAKFKVNKEAESKKSKSKSKKEKQKKEKKTVTSKLSKKTRKKNSKALSKEEKQTVHANIKAKQDKTLNKSAEKIISSEAPIKQFVQPKTTIKWADEVKKDDKPAKEKDIPIKEDTITKEENKKENKEKTVTIEENKEILEETIKQEKLVEKENKEIVDESNKEENKGEIETEENKDDKVVGKENKEEIKEEIVITEESTKQSNKKEINEEKEENKKDNITMDKEKVTKEKITKETTNVDKVTDKVISENKKAPASPKKKKEITPVTTPIPVSPVIEIKGVELKSDAFKADQHLFEQFQELQKQIEAERIRRAEIDAKIQNTTQQIAVVISKFETRSLAKTRMIKSIS